MSVRDFADHANLSASSIADIEAKGEHARLRRATQRILDEVLEGAPAEARQRFCVLAGPSAFQPTEATTGAVLPQSRPTSGMVLVETPPDAGGASNDWPVRSSAVTASEVDEILAHLREQWHALVRTDNLLGPRYALTGVLDHLTVLRGLMQVAGGETREHAVRLAAHYAESAGWLHEDAGELSQAQLWTSRAMEWAHEVNDAAMLAWTAHRRSQHAAATGDVPGAITLSHRARSDEEEHAAPMRAALRVQHARGYAMRDDQTTCLQLLDEARSWASIDHFGEARDGHGSFCTASYIEINRAECLAILGMSRKAIRCFDEAIPELPAVYRRDRAAALAAKSAAHLDAGQPEQAAASARAALPIARRVGSHRVTRQIVTVARRLAPDRMHEPVADLLDELAEVA